MVTMFLSGYADMQWNHPSEMVMIFLSGYADTWIPTGSLENSGYTDTQRIHSGKH